VEAGDFAAGVLARTLKAREVVVGFNHTFGRGARGTPALLEELGAVLGFAVHVVPSFSVDGLVVSSSAIRQALKAGDVGRAGLLLGRPYSVSGRVARGKERGRPLGFPTANLRPDQELIIPPGVYAARASWEGGSAAAVVNLGVRPTFGEGEYWLEAHLLDFSGDLYGSIITLSFVARLRPERKFEDVEALRAQIARDAAQTRQLL
jgi:riboflavin kinase/FMN adenylyltransferase